MKRLFLILTVMAIASSAMAWGNGWQSYGTSDNPLINAYYTSLYAGTILPLVPGTGSIGAIGNVFDFANVDSLRLADSLFAWKTADGNRNVRLDSLFFGRTNNYYFWLNSTELILQGVSVFKAPGFSTTGAMKQTGTGGTWADFAAGKLKLSGYSANGAGVTTGDTILTISKRGGAATLWAIDSLGNVNMVTGNLTLDAPGSTITADTAKFMTLATAKDTCLEVALFTRTCTRDTLAFMTGADSLTAAYIVTPFATRGAPSIMPYIAGIVGGKLVVDRPIADTAKYDRYSVTKIKQR